MRKIKLVQRSVIYLHVSEIVSGHFINQKVETFHSTFLQKTKAIGIQTLFFFLASSQSLKTQSSLKSKVKHAFDEIFDERVFGSALIWVISGYFLFRRYG